MKKIFQKKKGLFDSEEHYWKRRPSEIRGYTRTLYMTCDNGDYLRVDYNIKEKKVRLYLEDASEGGIPYYAVISNGKITAEKNAQTGRSVNLSDKFRARAEIFSTIGNHEVLKLINENYGIGAKTREKKTEERRIILERTRKRYFKPEEYAKRSRREIIKDLVRVQLIDAIDMAIGGMIVAVFYLYSYDVFYSSIISATFGIVIGAVDLFIRKRELSIIKIFAFLIAGAGLYFYGYFSR